MEQNDLLTMLLPDRSKVVVDTLTESISEGWPTSI